jgi:hypothetical protein
MEAVVKAGERAEGVGGRRGTRGPPEGAWRAVSATYGHAAAGFCRGATASRARGRAEVGADAGSWVRPLARAGRSGGGGLLRPKIHFLL